MKVFFLRDKKTGEVLNRTIAQNLEEAIDYFSIVKHLTTKDIINIFDVVEE